MSHLFNKTSEKHKRQKLRREMPRAERILWEYIRRRQVENCKFRRQYSVDRFVLDFYAPEIKLAIEVDGPTHHSPEAHAYDQARQEFIESMGITVLRFSNAQVYHGLHDVIECLVAQIQLLRRIKPNIEISRHDTIKSFSGE